MNDELITQEQNIRSLIVWDEKRQKYTAKLPHSKYFVYEISIDKNCYNILGEYCIVSEDDFILSFYSDKGEITFDNDYVRSFMRNATEHSDLMKNVLKTTIDTALFFDMKLVFNCKYNSLLSDNFFVDINVKNYNAKVPSINGNFCDIYSY